MWGRFFDSIGHDDGESVLSGSHAATGTDIRSFTSGHDLRLQSPQSEVHPNDSASVVDDDNHSVLENYARQKGLNVPAGSSHLQPDDGTYVFKFRAPSGRTHRFQSRHDDVEHLREIVAGKLATDPFFTEYKATEGTPRPDPIDFTLSYTDADGDTVVITSDHDVTEAVTIARSAKQDRVVLFVQGGKGWDEAGAGKGEDKAQEARIAAHDETEAVEKAEEDQKVAETPAPVYTPPKAATPEPESRRRHADNDEVFGIPKDLLLPASIGALAAVIIGVFTISRLTRSDY